MHHKHYSTNQENTHMVGHPLKKRTALFALAIVAACTALTAAREPAEVVSGNPEDHPYPDVTYNEKYRPQFHFTSGRFWNNDPNGMVYYDGEYHLFFQHNPKELTWGNMTWGHAVSTDMLHWKQMQHAIRPYDDGTIFSGSAVVDHRNSSGFGKEGPNAEKPIVAFYSHARKPFTQHIAYSLDRGRTWTRYKGNPVVPNQGMLISERDPKVFWHEPTKKWIMVLFVGRHTARIFNSDNLKDWSKLSDITPRGFHECPDLIELPVDGHPSNTKWVLYGATFLYALGTFDGKEYKQEVEPRPGDRGRNFYAAQTFNNTPDGRIIQMAWVNQCDFAKVGMPFNQQMSFPCRLTLRTAQDGDVRLCRWPVREIESLYKKTHQIGKTALKEGANPLKDIDAELIDLCAEIEMGSAERVVFNLRGSKVVYDKNMVLSAPAGRGELKPQDGKISLRMLVDRSTVEVFGNEGLLSITSFSLHEPENLDLSLTAEGGEATVHKIVVRELKSVWK